MKPLSDEDLERALPDFLDDAQLTGDDFAEAIRFSDGSLRSALTLLSGDGVGITRGFAVLAANFAQPDISGLHSFGDLIAVRGKEDNWLIFQAVARQYIHQRMRAFAPRDLPRSLQYSDLWDRTNAAIADSDALNLDRKQVAIDLVLAIWKLAREGEPKPLFNK